MKNNFKKLSKRTMALFLSLIMCLSLLPGTALAADETAKGSGVTPPLTAADGTAVTSTDKAVKVKKSITPVDGQKDIFTITLDVTTTASKEEIKIPTDADVVIVLDKSYSMCRAGSSSNKNGHNCATAGCALYAAKEAAKSFIDGFMGKGVEYTGTRQVGLVTFNGNTSVTPLNEDTSDIVTAIDNTKAGSSTNTSAALQQAYNMLHQSTATYKYVLLLTDGNPTTGGSKGISAQNAAKTQATNLKNDGVTLYAIGCDTTDKSQYPEYGGGDFSKLSSWLKSDICTQPSSTYYRSVTDSNLELTFQELSQEISKAAQGWHVEDPMSDFVEFAGFDQSSQNYYKVDKDGNKTDTAAAVYNGETKTFDWNLLDVAPITTEKNGVTYYTYQLKYNIKVDQSSALYEEILKDDPGSVPTNKTTTLHYYLVEDEKVTTSTVDFRVPTVTSQDGKDSKFGYTVHYMQYDPNNTNAGTDGYVEFYHLDGIAVVFSEITVSPLTTVPEGYTLNQQKSTDLGSKNLTPEKTDFYVYYDRSPANVVVKHYVTTTTVTNGVAATTTDVYREDADQTFPADGSTLYYGDAFPTYDQKASLGTVTKTTLDEVEVTEQQPLPTALSKGSYTVKVYHEVKPDTVNYTVEYYQKGENGQYPAQPTASDVTRSGYAGITVEVTTADRTKYEGYIVDTTQNNVESASLAADSSTVLKLYFTPAQQHVSYSITGGPTGWTETNTPSGSDKAVGSSVTVENLPTAPAGYHYKDGATEWTASPVITLSAGRTFTMPSNDVAFSAILEPDTNTPYRVEFYKKGANGYPAQPTDTDDRTGTTGTTVSVTDADKTKYSAAGYHYDTAVQNVESATLAAPATGTGPVTILKLYFAPDTHNVTYSITGGPANWTAENTPAQQTDVAVDSRVQPAALPPAPAGYHYSGTAWTLPEGLSLDADGKFTMPNSDVELRAALVPDDNVTYTVEFYKEGADGNYSIVMADTDTRYGTTGATVSVEPTDKGRYSGDGYTYNSSHAGNIESATLAAAGTVLKLYFSKTTKWDQLTITKSLAKVNGDDAVPGQKVQPGDTLTYTVTITNNTGKNLTNVKFSETPTNLTITSVTGTVDGAVITVSTDNDGNYVVASLADGKMAVLTVTATVVAEPTGNKAINEVKITDATDPGGEKKPTPDPNPGKVETDIVRKITGFSKTRVTNLTDITGLTVDGSADGTPLDLTKINTATPVVIDADGETLLYALTVTGTIGAKYVVHDEDATYVGGDPMTGTIPANAADPAAKTNSVTIYVTRTFMAAALEGSKTSVNNTAYVTPGAPDDNQIPTEVDPTKEDPKDPGKIEDGEDTNAKLLLPVTVAKTVVGDTTNLKAGDVVVWRIALTNPNDVAVDVTLGDALTVTKSGFTSTESYFTFYSDEACTTAVGAGLPVAITVPANGMDLYVKYTVQQGDVKLSNKATVTTPDTPDPDKNKDDTAPDVSVSGKTYTLTYDANGGENPPAPKSDTNNNGSYTFTISNEVPTRDGYTFLGWAATKGAETATMHGGQSLYTDAAQPDRTIYAVWQQTNVTVSYRFSPGNVTGINAQLPQSVTVPNGGSVNVDSGNFNSVPMKNADGYTIGIWRFVSWDTADRQITVTADRVITGTWTLEPPAPATYDVDVTKTLLPDQNDGTIRWQITVTNNGQYDYLDLSLVDSLTVQYADGTTIPGVDVTLGEAVITGGAQEPSVPIPDIATVMWVNQADPDHYLVKTADIARNEDSTVTIPEDEYPAPLSETGAWSFPREMGDGTIMIFWEEIMPFDPDPAPEEIADPGESSEENQGSSEATVPPTENEVLSAGDALLSAGDKDIGTSGGDLTEEADETPVEMTMAEAALAGSPIDLSHFALLAGQTLTVEVSVRVSDLRAIEGIKGGTHDLVNWAYVYDNLTPDPGDPGEPKKIGEAKDDTADVTVDEKKAVEISKTVDRSAVTLAEGESATVTFTITVRNTGNVDLPSVIVEDRMMPDGRHEFTNLAVGRDQSWSYTAPITETVTNVAAIPGIPGTPETSKTVTVTRPDPDPDYYPVIYTVTGQIPAGYPASTNAGPVVAGSYHTVLAAPADQRGELNGVSGTYTFSGWSWNGTSQAAGDQIPVNGPVTITGSWVFVPDQTGPLFPPPDSTGPGTATIPDTAPPLDDGATILDEEVPLAGAVGLNDTDHFAYIIGYDDDTVRPLNNITRAEVSTIFFRLMTEVYRVTNWSTSNSFTDVKSGDWYNNAISTCANAGALKGYEDGTFKPNASITRAEFAAIAARFLSDEYTDEGVGDFSDTGSHWAAAEIRRAVKAGWIRGDGNSFRPNDPITRAEVMTIVNRMLDRVPDAGHMLPTMKKWIDNPEDAWYYEAVQEATNEHDYERDELGVVETWTELLTVRDWKALEAEWAANGGASASQPDSAPAGDEIP